MSGGRCLEEILLFWLPIAVRRARSAWEASFLQNMLKRSRWRNWRPTPKEERRLRLIMRELFAPDPELIDRGGA